MSGGTAAGTNSVERKEIWRYGIKEGRWRNIGISEVKRMKGAKVKKMYEGREWIKVGTNLWGKKEKMGKGKDREKRI